jgi:hypothetical protein
MPSTELEEWRVIPGWEWYEVSSLGRIRTAACPCGRVKARLRKAYADPKWGHLRVVLRGPENRQISMGVHRAVALAFIGPPPSDLHMAAHNDGKTANNSKGNIRWATPAENEADRIIHGTSNRGVRQHMARLTAEGAKQVRLDYAAGHSQMAIAAERGVSRGCVQAVVENRSWAWDDEVRPPSVRYPDPALRTRSYRLDPEKVAEIRRRATTDESISSIARGMKVSRASVRNAITGKTWGWSADKSGSDGNGRSCS